MISLRKTGCGTAALRGSSISGGGRSSRSLRRNAPAALKVGPGQTSGIPRLSSMFSVAKPPGGAVGGVPWKEAPFSALAMGQQVQQGATGPVFGKGKETVWETVKRAMTKQRRVPLFNTHTNLSNQCGHMSFVILALAYLETDVLALRGYAASGIGLSILFQFYRPQPLWIPIGWNGLFLLINTSMIALLLRERSEAANIGDNPEQAKTFEEVFRRVELSPVDFVRLMDVAERRVVPKGTRLSQEGRVQEEVFLIVEGAAQVEAEGDAVGHLEQKQFVGSMAFNRFIQASPSPESIASSSESDSQVAAAATADPLDVSIIAGADGHSPSPSPSMMMSITTDKGSSEIRSVSPPLGDDTKEKETVNNDLMEDEDEDDDEDDMYVVEDDKYVPGGGGVFEEAKEVALNVLRRDSIVGNIAMAQSFVLDAEGHKRRGAGEMERSGTTVTATTEMVVYAWDMHLLRAFIKRRSLAGAAFMKAISADLIRKVDQSRGTRERYRLLLAEALDGGVITPIEKKKLHRYRDMHSISPKEHKELLREYEWREEEFEAGFQKGVAPRDGSKHFLAYEALVRRELAKGEVQDKERQKLRKFRAKAGIDAQEHLLALEKQGWTADDYELGGKGKAAGLQVAESDPAAKSGDMSTTIVDDGTLSSTDIKRSSASNNSTVKAETTAAEPEPEVQVEVEPGILRDEDEETATAPAKTEDGVGVERTATAARKPAIGFPTRGAQNVLLKASTSRGSEAASKLSAHTT